MDAFQELGFEIYHTGGGCQAYRFALPKGYILVTDDEGAGLPADKWANPKGEAYGSEGEFDPTVSECGRFLVPDNFWTSQHCKTMVGIYDDDDELRSFSFHESAAEAVAFLKKSIMKQVG